MPDTSPPGSGRVRPEAELDALLTDALARAFKTIPRDQFHAQTRFKVRLGHNETTHDATWAWELGGRADVIVFHQGRALVVVELKREDLDLMDADREQAQTCANQITPRPPLLIVTNGRELRTFDSSTGAPWSAGDDTEAAVAKLLENSAKVAAAGLRWAIEALMRPEAGIWTQAVRARSAELLADLTAPAGRGDRPFADGLLFPRYATREVLARLQAGAPIVLVEGAPLTGKSNVLRELVLRTAFADGAGGDLAVLLLRGAGGAGLFQRIANLFSQTLEWDVTAGDIRQWLRRISRFGYGPTLVLAVDGLDPAGAVAADLEELADAGFGPKVRVVATLVDAGAVLRAGNGRDATAVATHAARVEVAGLNLPEFRRAKQILTTRGVAFLRGSAYAADLRAPWYLRTLFDRLAPEAAARGGDGHFWLPPSMGLDQIDEAHQVFANETTLLRNYRVLARAALADSTPASPELSLAASHAFVVRRDVLAHVEPAVAALTAQGWVATGRHAGGEDIVVPTMPAVFLAELGAAAAEELHRRVREDAHAAGVWLGQRLELTYLGDLVGAEAIRVFARGTSSFPATLLWGLLSIVPRAIPVSASVIAFPQEDGSLQPIRIEPDGTARCCNAQGVPYGPTFAFGIAPTQMFGDVTAWMILGQVCRLPMGVADDVEQRMDATLLLEIGACRFPLVRANPDGLGHAEHDLGEHGRLLCLENGLIEAATHAMADLLTPPWPGADSWIDAAAETGSLPLLYRVMIALRAVRARSPSRAEWAHTALEDRIEPEIRALTTAALEARAASLQAT